MNRPSRTEDDLDHPDWNQNPPFLAPDLTTRQDLNGIANARVQRSRCAAGGAFALDQKHMGDMIGVLDVDSKSRSGLAAAMNGKMSFIASGAGFGGEGQTRVSRSSQLSGWLGWVVSVVAMSTFISFSRDFVPSFFASSAPSDSRHRIVADNSLPSRLPRRQDSSDAANTCGQGGIAGEYDVPLHVGALLIILAVSSIACGFPMLAAKFPVLRIPASFLFAIRHFGTGVLLATAFVHLLPTAFISLGDPCLSSFWTKDYPAMPGAIALFGIFFVAIIEMVFSPARQFLRNDVSVTSITLDDSKANDRPAARRGAIGHCSHAEVMASVARPSHTAAGHRHSIELASSPSPNVRVRMSSEDILEQAAPAHFLTPEQQHKKDIMQCMMLEVGILFHSVFIGMALSVSVGTDFVVLLIAIAFHQTFEGLALGARIAAIQWPEKTYQPWLMVLAYGCTTPIGQAIGLATHTLYSPNSEFGLILVGTMNAVSSGLLVFASLIELLAEDFLSDHSWTVMRGKKRVIACILVLLGAILMSLVGAWA